MEVQTVFASFEEMREFMRCAFISVGVPENDAVVCADVLIESDKRGIDSHGVARLKDFYIDRIKSGVQNAVTDFETVRETPTTAVVDGHDGMGHVISVKAMQIAIDKATEYGMGMVAVRNSTHYGIAGYYALMAAKNNMIGMTGTNARPAVAPTFGVENMYGTNPFTVGFPSDEEFPFIFDSASSTAQRGRIEHYARINKQMPEGWVIDNHGNTLTDPKLTLEKLNSGECALTPLGGIGEEMAGYKGYGFATVVEVLSAALQGGIFLKALNGFDSDNKRRPHHLGHFFIAIDIGAFIDPDEFKKTTGDIMRELRASKKAADQERIYTAGEKEYIAFLERSETGIPINNAVRSSLEAVRNECNVDFEFSWEQT